MKKSWTSLLAVILIASGAGTRVLAGDRIGIGVKAGTLGVGLDVTVLMTDWFSLRGSLNGFDLSRGYTDSNVHYEGDFKIGAYGVLADFHPLRNNFRLSIGYMKIRNEVDLNAHPTADVEIGGTTYTPQQVGTLQGNLGFASSGPYAGVGYGSAPKGPHRVRFLLDVGLLRQGSGTVSLRSSTGAVTSTDLQKEERKIESDIGDYQWWPVLALGISFRI